MPWHTLQLSRKSVWPDWRTIRMRSSSACTSAKSAASILLTHSARRAAPSASLCATVVRRSEEHTSELQSLMRISYAVFCLKKKKHTNTHSHSKHHQYNDTLPNNIC